MLLAHAITLTKARSYVAALADRASTAEASSAYEHALIELDWIHGDDVPALDTLGLTSDHDILILDAITTILQLADYAYVLETGRIVLEGPGEQLLDDEGVRKAYLGED